MSVFRTFTTRGRLGWLLLLLLVAAWFYPRQPDLLRVAPAQFECWHNGLRAQAGLYADQPELSRFAERPLTAFVSYLSSGRTREVSGAEWSALHGDVQTAFGRDRPNLPRRLRWRAADGETDYTNALYFRPTEAPFDTLPELPAPGDYAYLRLAGEAEPLQVFRVPKGATSGPLPNCRWYYDHWRIPDSMHYPLRFLAPWLGGVLALLLFAPMLARPLRSLLAGRAGGNPRLGQARNALLVTLPCAAGLGFSILDEPGWYTVVSGIVGFFSVITLVLLWRSGLRLQRIVEGDGQLLLWNYSPQEWRSFVNDTCGGMAAASRGGLILVGGMLLVAAVVVLIASPDEAGVITAAVLAGVLVIIAAVALVMPRLRRRWLEHAPPRVIIARGGVLAGNEFHDFRVLGSRFDGASVGGTATAPKLVVSYSYSARHGRQSVTLELPVPASNDQDLSGVVGAMNRSLGG